MVHPCPLVAWAIFTASKTTEKNSHWPDLLGFFLILKGLPNLQFGLYEHLELAQMRKTDEQDRLGDGS